MTPQTLTLATVVGARPQFVKAAVFSKAVREHNRLRGRRVREIIIHTGQHYDYEMSQVFFDELKIPKPDFHLGIGSGPHGEQTGKMTAGIEKILLQTKPDWLITYGDTNSTLAGGLAAAKLNIPIAHIEAGLRSYNRKMPEEINRVIVDHLSQILFAPTETAVSNLKAEGITKGVKRVPDLMQESLNDACTLASNPRNLKRLRAEKPYYLVTVHRSENTDDPVRLQSILQALTALSHRANVILPLHPRTRKAIETRTTFRKLLSRLRILDPLPYLDMAALEKGAEIILTDSGGVQKEAYWLNVPCITLRDETEWVETLQGGRNILTGANTVKILAAVDEIHSRKRAHRAPLRKIAAGRAHLKALLST